MRVAAVLAVVLFAAGAAAQQAEILLERIDEANIDLPADSIADGLQIRGQRRVCLDRGTYLLAFRASDDRTESATFRIDIDDGNDRYVNKTAVRAVIGDDATNRFTWNMLDVPEEGGCYILTVSGSMAGMRVYRMLNLIGSW